MIKNVIIYDQLDAEILFLETNKKITHLHNVYINADGPDSDYMLQEELNGLIYGDNSIEGNIVLTKIDKEKMCENIRLGGNVIVCGFLP